MKRRSFVHGNYDDSYLVRRFADFFRRKNTVHAGHRHVHQHDVGTQFERGFHSLGPVGSRAHDFKILFLRQKAAEPFAE